MPNQIQVTEPHPSIAKRLSNKFKSSDTVRLPSARGGAGNIRTYHRSELTSGLPEDTTTVVQPSFSKKQVDDCDAASQRSNSSSGSSINSAASSSKPRMMFRGIGGAGNAVSMDERRMFSFDEELEREEMMRRSREKSRVVMVGRGGAGNAVR